MNFFWKGNSKTGPMDSRRESRHKSEMSGQRSKEFPLSNQIGKRPALPTSHQLRASTFSFFGDCSLREPSLTDELFPSNLLISEGIDSISP